MQPEHYDFTNPVFLPVSLETCQGLLDAQDHSALDALGDAQLAAVLVIQNLVEAKGQVLDPSATEKVLARLLAWSVDVRHSPGIGLLSEARRLFDARKLYFGLELIKGSKLHLLMADEVAAGEYLLPDGKWDFEFKIRRHQRNNPFRQQAITRFDRERWLTAVRDGGVLGPHGLVFLGLFAVAVAVATWSFRRARHAADEVPRGLARVVPLLPFGTLLTAAVVPLATGVYVVTAAAWTAAAISIASRALTRSIQRNS